MGGKALLRACKEMYAAHTEENWDDAEIVGTPKEYWLGDRRISSQTVTLGLYGLLFSVEGVGTDYERITLNERGRELAQTGRMPSFNLRKST